MGIGKWSVWQIWTLLQKAGRWFLGPDIISSDLHTQFFFNGLVPNIVLGLGEMKMMASISGCWEPLKCEVYLGFNHYETMQSQRRSVPGPQTFHTHNSGLKCPPSLPILGMIMRALYEFLDSFPCRHMVILHFLIPLTMELQAWSLIWSMKYKWTQCLSL